MMTFREERKDDFQDSGEETDFPPCKEEETGQAQGKEA
jgi:hypothetical protein